jgi:hypothetical protein
MFTCTLLRALFWPLSATVLIAQSALTNPDQLFLTNLGSDPKMQIQLTAPGWSTRILLSGPIRLAKRGRKDTHGSTVEVWDYALPEFQSFETFLAFKERLHKNLQKAFQNAPMSYASYDLSLLMEYMATRGSAAGIDMVNVQNMLSRYGSANPAGIRTPSSTDAPPFMGRRR